MNEMKKEERTVEAVTLEINTLHRQAQQMVLSYAVEIGRRLVEVKGMLPYGSWGNYLKESTPYSQSTANNFMQIFSAYGDENLSFFEKKPKSQTFGELTYTQALALLALPESERTEFVEQNDVEEMSTRQLKEAIRERNEARAEAERLKLVEEELKKVKAEASKVSARELEKAKADLKHAEESRSKMESDMNLLNQRLSGMNEELKELRDRPVEVAVMEVDQKELEKAKAEGAAQARAEDQEVAMFQILFRQAQEIANQMADILNAMEAKGKGETAGKLRKAMAALAAAIQSES